MPRTWIGLLSVAAMLLPLAAMGGRVAAAPSYPEVATPSPLARYVLGSLRERGCSTAKGCRRVAVSLPPSP
jgi:hypothetical protein